MLLLKFSPTFVVPSSGSVGRKPIADRETKYRAVVPDDIAKWSVTRHMLFGHNTNVTVGDTEYHVQTEDRGPTSALIDTTVYHRGRVLHRRTNNYFDLLPLDEHNEPLLKLRLDEQHLTVIKDIRSGSLQLPSVFSMPGQSKAAGAATPAPAPPAAAAPLSAISLELTNGGTWLAAKRATLQLLVRQKGAGSVIAGANVSAHVDGAATPKTYSAVTGADGRVQLEFDMPPLSGAEPALVIAATHAGAQAQLRYQLRAKPKVSAS